MYFKRDTDYALRIIMCLAKDKISGGEGMKLSMICRETNTPINAARRIMKQFVDGELAGSCGISEKTPRFFINGQINNISLMDVFRTVEINTEPLSVFEKDNPVYKKYGSLLPRIEETVYRQFETISLCDILKEKI